jgi:hypothetical protein
VEQLWASPVEKADLAKSATPQSSSTKRDEDKTLTGADESVIMETGNALHSGCSGMRCCS